MSCNHVNIRFMLENEQNKTIKALYYENYILILFNYVNLFKFYFIFSNILLYIFFGYLKKFKIKDSFLFLLYFILITCYKRYLANIRLFT